jgi:Protein of unknown function (DUF1559)
MTAFRRLRTVTVAALTVATVLLTPEPNAVSAAPQDKLPAELRMIPGESAMFVHADVAALYDSGLGDSIRNSKSLELKDKLAEFTKELGVSIADIKTVTFALPKGSEVRELQRGIVCLTFRKEYDRKKVIAGLKESATKMKDEFSEKDGLVSVTSNRFGKRTVTTDVTNPLRVVVLNDLPDSYLKPSDDNPQGTFADAIKQAAKSPFVFAVNFNILPDEIRGENLPAEARPFQPIFKADSLIAVGSLTKEKVELTVRVRSKDKANAAEVEKSFGAVQTFAAVGIPQAKKQMTKDLEDATAMTKFLDGLEKVVSGAKFSVEDKDAIATLTAPTDFQLAPFFEMLAGGGASARMQSSNNLKQLALAVYNYESAYGHYPPAASLGKKGKKLMSWRVAILPYIEQDALYKQFNHDEPWDSEHNMKVFKDNPMPKVFALPGTKNLEQKKTHYQTFVGNGAMFETVAALKITDIQDGTSNTVMIATAATPVEWTKPDDIEFDPKADVKKLFLFQGKVTQVAMGDGSVRAMSETVEEKVLKALITRNGGEVIGNDF